MNTKIISRYAKIVVFWFSLVACACAFAADPPPMVIIKNTSDRMIVELNRNINQLQSNLPLVEGIVRRIALPRFELNTMAQFVVGRYYWQQSSPALQQEFIRQFTTYVIRTYASAISSYDGETISFFPIRNYTPGQARVQINSNINRKDGPPTQVQYRMVATGGTWLVYDFSVNGVSLVQNYRSQFAGTLQQGGLTLLVQQLQQKNRGH